MSGELSRLLGTVISVWAGWYFYRPLGSWLLQNTRLTEKDIYAVSFFICLIGVFVLILLFRLVLHRIIEISIKGNALNRIGGCLAGACRMFIFCAAIIFFLNLLPIPYLQNSIEHKSFFGRTVTRHIPVIYMHAQKVLPFLPPLAEDGQNPIDQTAYDPSKDIPATDPYVSNDNNLRDDNL